VNSRLMQNVGRAIVAVVVVLNGYLLIAMAMNL